MGTAHVLDPRSVLFVPGNRADMVAKVVRQPPDAVVVDLEDAVSADDKAAARKDAVKAIADLDLPDATAVLIRVNPPGTPWFTDDIRAAAGSRAGGVVVPKAESAKDVAAVRKQLEAHGQGQMAIVGGVETAAGVAGAREMLASEPQAVYFGAEDFIADMGGRRTPEGLEVLYARSQVVLAARLAGVPALDQVVVSVRDDERFVRECREARALGYSGKMCIHPRQVDLAHQEFTPTDDEVAKARRVADAAAAGVGLVDGEMVDAVHLKLAQRTLARASRHSA